jgi:hypothetical protein
MRNETCKEVRARIALGDGTTEQMDEHVRNCAGCRVEGARIGRLVRALARDAELAVPARLDLGLRTLLAQWEGAPRSILRPGLAIALAVLAILAGVLSLVGWQGASGADNLQPLKIAAIVWLYLAFASVATLPMVFHLAVRRRESLEGVQE